MKKIQIPGSFYNVDLLLKDGLIEFQIKKRDVVEYRANIMDFSEIEFDLSDILEENKIFLPQNRMDIVLQELEAKYFELQKLQAEEQERNLQMQKSYSKSYQVIKMPVDEKVKILLMGGSGKTSIYQMIFENKVAYEIQNTSPTHQVEKHDIDFASVSRQRKGQKLEVWETGSFFPEDDYFSEGSLLLFVIDAYDVENYDAARVQLHQAMAKMDELGFRPESLPKNVPSYFCFIHKMDRFQNIGEKFTSLVRFFRENPETGEIADITFFPTSIFDSSIYRAWIKIVESLMPKSSKLNQLSNQLKEDLALYTVLIIEKRTGLPICSSKTLLDDSTLVGTTNRIMITIEKVLPDYKLTNMQDLRIDTSTGFLKVKVFQQYYILVLISPPNVDIESPESKKKISRFIQSMKDFI